MDEVQRTIEKWSRSLHRAVEADSYGQVIEAVETYERLADSMAHCSHQLDLDRTQRDTLDRIIRALDLRAKSLSSVINELDAPSKDDMQLLVDALRSVPTSAPVVVPLSFGTGHPSNQHKSSESQQSAQAELEPGVDTELATLGRKQQAVHRAPGARYLDICVERIGLKDASSYINPTIVVSVHDKEGKVLEEQRETSVGKCSEPLHVVFGTTIQLETSLEKMQASGASVFLEFVHYKPKKRKKSCRCWALLEMDEVKDGTIALELYQKPKDPKKKRINLFTVKDLFLHLRLQQQRV